MEVSYVMKDPQKSPWLFQYNESWSFISWISSMVWGTPILGNLHIYIYDSIYDHMYIYNYIYIISIKKKKRSDLIPRTRLEDSRLIRRRSARKPTELERWIASRTKETMMQSWLHKGSRKHGDFMGFHHHLWRF